MTQSYKAQQALWRRRRGKIARLYKEGKGPTAIAKILGVSKQRVNAIFQDMKSRGQL